MDKFRFYEDKQAGFALAYPANWFLLPGNKLPTSKYVELFVMDVPVFYKIELRVYSSDIKQERSSIHRPDFGSWIVRKNNDDNRIIARRRVYVGRLNYQGEEIIYENDRLRGRIITIVHNKRVYAVELSTVKSDWNDANVIFDRILNTLEFVE